MRMLFNKRVMILLTMLLFQLATFAQTTDAPVEMADSLYQSGKIYVVVTGIATIFIGIIIYLVLLDKKISKLEKKVKN